MSFRGEVGEQVATTKAECDRSVIQENMLQNKPTFQTFKIASKTNI